MAGKATNAQYQIQTGEEWEFSGFVFPTTTPVPDQIFDELLHRLSGAELKVLLYIVRRTFGFKKQSDDISLAQLVKGIRTRAGKVLDRGTGLGKTSVARALNSLEEKNIILRTRRRSEYRGNQATTYTLNIVPPLSQNETRGVPKAIQGLSRQQDTQQTVSQQTDKQQQSHSSASSKKDVAAALVEKGIERKTAQRLASRYNRERVLDNVDLLEYVLKTSPRTVSKNPAGWLRRAIEGDYAGEGSHPGFKTRRQEAAAATAQKLRLAAQQRREEARQRQQEALAQQQESARVKQLEMLRERYGTTKQEEALWSQVLSDLKEQITPVAFNTYLAKSALLSLQNGKALIGVPNRFVKEWVEGHLSPQVQQALADHLDGRRVVLRCLALDEADDE